MLAGVYIIRNIFNDKVYIGSTININERWNKHKCVDRSTCHRLRNAMKKHGVEQFYWEWLEPICVDGLPINEAKNLLLSREQHYLNEYNPFHQMGYNICKIAGSTLGISYTQKSPKCGYKHPPSFFEKVSSMKSIHNKPVCKFTMSGELLNTYFNITDAHQQNSGATIQAISKCCKKKAKSAGGFLWTYEGNVPEQKIHKSKQVSMYDTHRKLIKIFTNAKQAAKYLNKSDNPIYKCCRGEQNTAHGYIWEWI